jgi:hypothetical protein
MTVVLSICAFVNFLVIIVGVPHVLWKEKPKGSIGLIWWVIAALPVVVFSGVSLIAALGLAASPWTAAHIVLFLAVLFIPWMFFNRRTLARS